MRRGKATSAPTLIRGRYQVLEVIGEGGQGQVVKALDRQHQRLVALKVRRVSREEDREALLSEARVLLSLAPHPGISIVREDFFVRDRYYMVSDFVEGTSLQQLLREQGTPGLPVETVAAYLEPIAEALDHVHAQHPPVIHQDVKPANMILTPEGRVVLVDFGIAGAGGRSSARQGTAGYAAPEIGIGGPLSPATDVYGLAATAFALLTGAPLLGPVDMDTLPPRIRSITKQTLRPALAFDPAKRPGAARALVGAMRADRVWHHEPIPRPAVMLVAGGGVVAVLGAALTWVEAFGLQVGGLDHGEGIATAVIGVLAVLAGLQLWRGFILQPRWNRLIAGCMLGLTLIGVLLPLKVGLGVPDANSAPDDLAQYFSGRDLKPGESLEFSDPRTGRQYEVNGPSPGPVETLGPDDDPSQVIADAFEQAGDDLGAFFGALTGTVMASAKVSVGPGVWIAGTGMAAAAGGVGWFLMNTMLVARRRHASGTL